MIRLDMPIIVEGKYDKIKLSSIFDAVIIETNGFSIFKDKEKTSLIKKLAEKNGVIVLTDSDSAGGIIRSYLKNILGEDKIHHILLPALKGKERRKAKPSKEGFLGVEGTDEKIIVEAFERFIIDKKPLSKSEEIDTGFLMSLGLSGGKQSRKKREFLLNALNLPNCISPKTFKKILSEISSKEEIVSIMKEFKE